MATVSGSVDRIVFRNSESGFCVARFRLQDPAPGDPNVTTIVGTMPSVREGELLRLMGDWQTHPLHGRNFRVEQFEEEMPTTVEGIERYLASGAIRGVGPVTASRIIEHFGERTLEVIDQRPDLLENVAGISQRRVQIIRESWDEQKRVRELMLFLQTHGISVALAGRIYEKYGDEAPKVIQQDPYRLAHEVHGIGFRTADSVARHLGMPRNSESRYVAGLKFVLSEATDEGHAFLPRPELLRRACKLLGAGREELEPALLALLHSRDAKIDDDAVYLGAFYRAEAGSAKLLRRLAQTPSALTLDRRFDPARAVKRASSEQGLILADKQLQAAEQALREKVAILTGGPGTGKTSTLRTVITALEEAGIQYCLCAPTGRAAKRVAETTGRPASTIHRLLEYQPATNSFGYDLTRPLEADFVVVDEASMLDCLLFYHLLKAIPAESHLLLVGDKDQLPAVGPGNVLADLIASESIPTTILTDLFRQVRGSQIVVAAHEINHGALPVIENGPNDDLFFIETNDEVRVVENIKHLMEVRIPRRFGFDPVQDVQVISPMHAGPAGVVALNEALQAVLNPLRPGMPELRRAGRTFRNGDKVMQVRNNYDKDVYNGDTGRIVAIRDEDPRLVVAFGSTVGTVEVEYDAVELDELVLAYAVSVHKAQGSEFPCVVLPLVLRHRMLLQRNLLYTAITRAKQLCVLVGSSSALRLAAETDRREQRNTQLARRLREKQPADEQLELA